MNDSLIWVDLETTGLDPQQDRILEIAVVVTDGQLNVIDQYSSIVAYPGSTLLLANPTVEDMHRRSGLLAEMRSTAWSPEIEPRSLDLRFEAFVAEHGATGAPLAGSNVQFDRNFLRRWMPRLEDAAHYRNVDVSTLKELMRRWHPEVPEWEKTGDHRALSDILDSIAELKFYRARFFR